MDKKHKGYLTLEEREIISQMRYAGKSLKDIGDSIGRDKSVISRELSRNLHPKKKTYTASIACRLYQIRKSKGNKRKRLKSVEIRLYVVNGLKEFWSPEQISGRINIDLPGNYICKESIYQFIYDPFVRVNICDFPAYLRQRRVKRRKRGKVRRVKRSLIPNRIPIELRPKEVEERSRFGDWEGDSMVSSKSTVSLNTLVDRKSSYTKIRKIQRKGAKETRIAITSSLKQFPKHLKKTLTIDNGSEFTQHERITKVIGIKCYFANPYHSWERGTNENTNGLIRQFFPKGTDFKHISEEQIETVEKLLNTRPRKKLNYRTPEEVLQEELEKVA